MCLYLYMCMCFFFAALFWFFVAFCLCRKSRQNVVFADRPQTMPSGSKVSAVSQGTDGAREREWANEEKRQSTKTTLRFIFTALLSP